MAKSFCQRIRIIPLIIFFIGIIILEFIFFTFHPYVIINQEIYNTKVKSITLDFNRTQKNTSLRKLKYFKNLKMIDIQGISKYDSLENIKASQNLKEFECSFSDITDTMFIRRLPKLKSIFMMGSSVDLVNIKNYSLNEMTSWSCKVKHMNKISNCTNLRKLELFQTKFNGIQVKKGVYTLQDSSVFAQLNQVKELDMGTTVISDLTGILNMKSLKKFTTTYGCLTKQQSYELEKAGIEVVVEKNDDEDD